MRYFIAISSILLLSSGSAFAADPPCDRIMGAMSDGCKSIADRLLSIQSVTEPNSVCCTNFRYRVCVQSTKAYAAVARVTKVCPEEHYVDTVKALEDNPLLLPIKATCENFDAHNCFVKQVTNLWNNIKTEVNTDVDALGGSIGKGWNEAVSSVSTFAKDISKQFEEKSGNFGDSFKDKAKELKESVTKNFNEGKQKLKDMFSNGDANNRYSMVDGDDKSQGTLDSFVHSIVPEVEFVPKGSSDKAPSAPVKVDSGSGNSFMNFFQSIAGTLQPPNKQKVAPAPEGNPYSVV